MTNEIVSTILKHDRKVNSYKIALLRSINDIVLAFPDMVVTGEDVAIPLRILAERWAAYYWPFVDDDDPIWQGQRAKDPRSGELRNDISFRPRLTQLKRFWEMRQGGASASADGFILVSEFRMPRRQKALPPELQQAYEAALKDIARAILYPIQYAGPGEWSVFARPQPLNKLDPRRVVAIPGAHPEEKCLVVGTDLWQTFQGLSLWVEALCIHEWSLFTERANPGGTVERGGAYTLLTARPDNRRPLSWERNRIDLLIMEGGIFTCPWTKKKIGQNVVYDIDHLLPLAVYPTNELWNLVPCDPGFNQHRKRDRLPSADRIQSARPHLASAYAHYERQPDLGAALHEDVALRFTRVDRHAADFPTAVAGAVTGFLAYVADSRNLPRF